MKPIHSLRLLASFGMFLASALPALASPPTVPARPEIRFTPGEVDFDTVKDTTKSVSRDVTFQNDTNGIIKLTGVKSSCDSLEVSKFASVYMIPGSRGVLRLTYYPNGRVGEFNETIVISANTVTPRFTLKVRIKVVKPQPPAPIAEPVGNPPFESKWGGFFPRFTPREAATLARRAARGVAENPLETQNTVWFGRAPTGTSSAQHVREFRLRNRADSTVNVTGLQVSGDHPGDFAVTPPADASLATDEEGVFSVKFTPSADGQRFATLTVTTDSAAYPAFHYELTGFGQATQSAPVSVADTLFAPAAGFVEFTKLLTNDTDADTDPLVVLSAAEIPGTTRGLVYYDVDSARVYYIAPDDGSTGADSFTYTVGDRSTTITATASVQIIDPATVAAGKSFRGSEDGDTATVTFGKLTPSAAAARKAVRSGQPRPRGGQASQSLTATISETVHGRKYSGKVAVDAQDNDGDGALKGAQDNEEAKITMSCDQDGNPIVQIYNPDGGGIEALGSGGTITLYPDVFDKKHPAPPEIVGTYTIALRGQDLDDQPARGLGDSVASVTLSADGKVKISGVMADGAPFTGSTELSADNFAPFYIPLYKGNAKGSFSGILLFMSGGSEFGSLLGFGTWDKPLGITAFAEPTEFKARGNMFGGFYTPEELPSTLTCGFTFGNDDPALATGNGTLAKKFSLTGNLNAGGSFTLDSAFTLKTGLILGKRPRNAASGPLSFSGVVLQEQSIVAGSAVFTDVMEGDTYTAPVTGEFPP